MSITTAPTTNFSKYAQYALAILLTTFLIIFSGIRIYSSHEQPIFDQKALIYFSFAEGYPRLEQGITSTLIVGIVHYFKPYEPLSSNAIIRTLASCLYLASGSLLAWALKKRYYLGLPWFALFILLIFTSRFPFLWLSSELFAGAFLMLVMWSVINEYHFVLIAFFVALFSLAKPDLILPGLALGIILAVYDRKRFQNKILSVFLIMLIIAAFVLPGLMSEGPSYLQLSNRSFISFCQHYADVVSDHQIIRPVPNPWLECQTYVIAGFGNRHSILTIIKSNWARYMDFMFLSLSRSLRKMVASNLIFLMPLSIAALWKMQQKKIKVAMLSVFVINLGLITMLSYFHVRYQTRYYPPALLIALIGMNEIKSKNIKLFLWGYLIMLLVLQIYQSVSVVTTGYFFPD